MKDPQISLTIISPDKIKKVEVNWIEIETPNGNFFVGIDHAFLVSSIKLNSKIRYQTKKDKEIDHKVSGGIFEIKDNKATILEDF